LHLKKLNGMCTVQCYIYMQISYLSVNIRKRRYDLIKHFYFEMENMRNGILNNLHSNNFELHGAFNY